MIPFLEYLSWILLAGVKFLLVPSAMMAVGYSWWVTVLVCTFGAFLSVCVFYFGAEIVTHYVDKWRRKPKRIFTKGSRRLVRIRSKYGFKGLVFIGAFISVPVTAIIAARYFNKPQRDIPGLALGYFLWTLLLTTLSYIVRWLFP